jgi:hypothetical protein
LLQLARQFQLEGLIAKRPDSPYEAGRRSGAWVKVKLTQQQEFVIGGYTPPGGSRKYFGAQDGKKTDFYGANRQRQETYDANGCVSIIIARSDLPKFANLRASSSTPLAAASLTRMLTIDRSQPVPLDLR